MNKRVHLLITGRVQGVWYRSSMKQQAEHLGLTGWVKNLPSGEVEAVVEGDEITLDKLISWCYTGPSLAEVKHIKIDYASHTGKFSEFKISY